MKWTRHCVLAPKRDATNQCCIYCGEVMATWPNFMQPGYILKSEYGELKVENKRDENISSCFKPKKK